MDESKDLVTRKQLEGIRNTVTRRGLFGGMAALTGLAAAAGFRPGMTAAQAFSNLNIIPEDLPAPTMKAAFSEVGAASTWVAHGIETSKFFGSLLGVEVESFDGTFNDEKQLQDMQQIATGDYDFVAIHPSASDAYVEPATEIIGKGIPLVVMDTRLVQDPVAFAEFGHLTYLEPDNIYMGSTVAKVLFDTIGGEGQVVHTQGQLSHTGAQGRAKGFNDLLASYPGIEVVDETPADWLADKTASLWQDLLTRYPDLKGGYFHSDDMALAASSVVESAGMQDQVKIVGVDGLRNACEAILQDKLLASVINPSGRIHSGAMWAGYLKASGTDQYKKDYGEFPKFMRMDGGPITKDNAAGYIWLGDNYLY